MLELTLARIDGCAHGLDVVRVQAVIALVLDPPVEPPRAAVGRAAIVRRGRGRRRRRDLLAGTRGLHPRIDVRDRLRHHVVRHAQGDSVVAGADRRERQDTGDIVEREARIAREARAAGRCGRNGEPHRDVTAAARRDRHGRPVDGDRVRAPLVERVGDVERGPRVSEVPEVDDVGVVEVARELVEAVVQHAHVLVAERDDLRLHGGKRLDEARSGPAGRVVRHARRIGGVLDRRVPVLHLPPVRMRLLHERGGSGDVRSGHRRARVVQRADACPHSRREDADARCGDVRLQEAVARTRAL